MSKLPVIIVFALLLTGCLELEQRIVVAADGSAVFTYIYDIPNENLPLIEGYFASLTPANNSFLNEAAIKKFYNRPQDGIELRGYKRTTKNNRTTVQIIILTRNYEKAFKTNCFPSIAFTKATENTPNRLELKFPPPPEDWSEEDIAQMATLCKGLKLSCELQVPSAIKNTIGHKRTPRSAVWHFSADTAAAQIFKTLPPVYVEW
ncbi:MAG: hypothetical protein IKX30_18700 [Victivallales bacterium]|nr:hypothetical protein [Victivallales bacterium]